MQALESWVWGVRIVCNEAPFSENQLYGASPRKGNEATKLNGHYSAALGSFFSLQIEVIKLKLNQDGTAPNHPSNHYTRLPTLAKHHVFF